MPKVTHEDAVSAHYTAGDLDATILAHLRAVAWTPTRSTWKRSRRSTSPTRAGRCDARPDPAGIEPGMRVLDVGGGLGGAARLIAHDIGCAVTVLDLAAEACRVRELLTARIGLADRVTSRHGSALDVPFADGAFDVAWTQHATMNIPEKGRLYREIHRVLQPGGRLAM